MTGKKPLIIEVSTEKEWLTLLTLQVRREISKYYVEKKRIIFHKKIIYQNLKYILSCGT